MRLQVHVSLFLLYVTSTSSFDLKCTSGSGTIAYISTTTYCSVKSLTITSRNERITSVNGVSTPTSFEGISFNSLTVHYLPKGLGEFFPKMKELRIDSTGLKSIEAEDLKNLASLESLYSSNNPITALSSDLFKSTPKITHLTFPNNQIAYTGVNLLTNLNYLKWLYFMGNKCINSHITSDFEAFKTTLRAQCPDLKGLQEKYCSGDFKEYEEEINNLKAELAKMKQESIVKLQEETQKSEELKEFKQENRDLKAEIERMKRDWYHGLLDSCTKLLYEGTKTPRNGKDNVQVFTAEEEITATALNTTEAQISLGLKIASPESKILKIVDISNNEKQPNQTEIVIDQQNALFLPINLGQIFSSAQKLSVTFSGLFRLDARTFYNMDKLIKANFTGNKIIEISEGIFSEMPNLQELDLSFNNIWIISKNAFMNNKNLKIVKLNHNQLTKIDAQLFSKQEKLKKLFLNDNKLKFIDADFLTPLKALEVVDFSKNVCIDVSSKNKTMREIAAIISDKCIAPVEVKCKGEVNYDQNNENTCEVEELMLISPRTQFVFAENVKKELIENLSIVNQKMLFVPYKLSELLPGLLSLNIENSSLTTLQKGNFEGLSKVQSLKIVKNNISLIEEGVFDEIPQIVHLSLAHNNIEFLPPKVFFKLMKMETLMLAGNRLRKFTANLMPPKRNALKDLQLQNNQLEFIEIKVLRLLRNAELVDLSDNECISSKFQKSDPKGKTMRDLTGDVEYDCADDSSEENKIK